MRREADERYEPLFKLESWRVIVEKHSDGHATTEATIKIWVGAERYIPPPKATVPVNALDAALRKAIGKIHPHLKDIELVNFKVRILDETKGTGAVTRVLIDASDGHDVWGSIGVSENLIAASWDALVDSLEYGMQATGACAGPAAAPQRRRVVRGSAARRHEDGGLCLTPTQAGGGAETPIPLARPVIGEREEQAVLEVLRSGQLSLGPRAPEFERVFAAQVGAPRRARSRAGPRGFTSPCARSAWGRGTR